MKNIKILISAIAVILLWPRLSSAQDDMTTYTLSTVPQAYYDNPGQMPRFKFHIGCLPVLFMPVLSSNFTSISNSGFRYDNLIHQRKENDSLYVDFEDVVDGLAKKNYLILNQQFELISFGFKIKHTHYISFSWAEKLKFRFTYPRDLFSMLWNGNSQFIGSEADFSGIGIDMTQYREFAFGYTNQINSKWTVGGRLKLLFGLSNVWTKKSNVTLAVDKDYFDLTAKSDLELYTSAPDKLYSMFENDSTYDSKKDSNFVKNYLLNFGNPGFGIDLGVNYNIDNKWTVGASIIDFGYIFWKTGTRKYSMKDKSFTFRGFEAADFFLRGDSVRDNALKQLTDSLVNIFKIEDEKVNYVTPLNPKIYLSCYYNISKKARAAFIFRGEIYENTIHPAFTLAYNRLFGKILDLSVSYSYMNRDFLNLGMGASLKFGPFQFFLSTDNFLAAIIPYHTKNINVHFGCNYVFYYKPSYPLMK